jgi:hypothetical protein
VCQSLFESAADFTVLYRQAEVPQVASQFLTVDFTTLAIPVGTA